MQPREFMQTTALGVGLTCLPPTNIVTGINGELSPELKKIITGSLKKIRHFDSSRIMAPWDGPLATNVWMMRNLINKFVGQRDVKSSI